MHEHPRLNLRERAQALTQGVIVTSCKNIWGTSWVEGKPDIYFPRTDIPRPIYEDTRKMLEKKRRLAKIEKKRHKKE